MPLFSTCLRDQVRVPGGQMGQLRWGDGKKSVSSLDSGGPSEDAAEGEGSTSEPTALALAGPCFCPSMSSLILYVSPSPSLNQVSIRLEDFGGNNRLASFSSNPVPFPGIWLNDISACWPLGRVHGWFLSLEWGCASWVPSDFQASWSTRGAGVTRWKVRG